MVLVLYLDSRKYCARQRNLYTVKGTTLPGLPGEPRKCVQARQSKLSPRFAVLVCLHPSIPGARNVNRFYSTASDGGKSPACLPRRRRKKLVFFFVFFGVVIFVFLVTIKVSKKEIFQKLYIFTNIY